MLKFSFRQVLTGFIVSLLLVFTVFYFSYTSINNLQENEKAVARTLAVIKTSIVVQALLLDCETGQQGYIATGKYKFLEPYNRSISLIPASLTDLKALIRDNPVQLQNLDSLTFFANLKSRDVESIVQIARVKGFDTARKVLSGSPGIYDMDRVRFWVAQVVKEENRLLKIRIESSDAAVDTAGRVIVFGGIIVIFVVLMLSLYIRKSFTRLISSEESTRVSKAELEKVLDENKAKNWLLTGTSLLNEKMLGKQNEKELAENILTEICSYAKVLTGTFYLYSEVDDSLDLYASYAFHDLNALKKSVKLSEGWLGQVAKNKQAAVVRGKLNDKLELGSSIIHQNLTETFIVPFFFDSKLKGVIELAFENELETRTRDYILIIANVIGVAVNTAQAFTITYNLLSQVREQAEELETQREEMRVTNESLLSKTEMLQASEEELRVQQEELRTANAELEEKADLLEGKNRAIEAARLSINSKVKELETTGRYKSEFLANMSHELRTPLNSILVLARILKDNKPANLSTDQVKYAGVIFSAGNDLLILINDILDLSKIESGKLEMHNEDVKIADILNDMEMLFAEFALNKKIKYSVSAGNNLPEKIFTDKVRVEQVIKNLLSNAFKFTPEKGSISINVIPGIEDNTISFCIKDSGIGIAPDKQKIIFEAFQQADGSTSRKYGGTGLGLSISRELVTLLAGNIKVISGPGKGSEFILTIPVKPEIIMPEEDGLETIEAHKPATGFLKPANQTAKPYNREPLVIIIEDDKNFADILKDYSRDHGYRSIIVNEGTNAVEIIKKNQPEGVILDIMLPGKDGWQILKELKGDEATAHIPVHLMSANDEATNHAGLEGAISFIKKPIAIETIDQLFSNIMLQSGIVFKQVLLIEDNKTQSAALNELMLSLSITVDQAFDGAAAMAMLNENEYQCVILDINLPDISGLDLLDKIKAIDRFKMLPVIINTAMELDQTSVSRLMKYANAMVMKTNKSTDRLIDEVNLFLNKVRDDDMKPKAPVSASKIKINPKGKDAIKEKKILIVDDDMRNIFALSSALQSYDMLVEIAYDGQEAINKLDEIADIDLVLMDIMMPVMDGYEATRYIRKQNKYAKLPVIALTAKAMTDDREKCIAAGANDYITKPVDIDKLIALLRLWLSA